MSTNQRLTLIGLYNFNSSLFDKLTLPDGYDKQTFIDSLLLEHGEKCILYTNPDFFADAIGAWGRKWYANLERIYTALTEEYNPLHNFDRFEEYTDNEGRKYSNSEKASHTATDTPSYSDTQTNNNTDTQTNNNTDTTTNNYDVTTSVIDQAVTEHTVSADNSSAYQADWKEISNGGKNKVENDGTITDAHTGTITDAHTGTIKHDISGTTQNLTEGSSNSGSGSETHNFTHNGHLYGNIGVTTSVQMLTSEVDARMKYNLYEAAGRLFANELLIGIY